jgi:hypothetical protein
MVFLFSDCLSIGILRSAGRCSEKGITQGLFHPEHQGMQRMP